MAFETYVERVLAPELRAGDVVIMDNLSSNKSDRTRHLIQQAVRYGIAWRAMPNDLPPWFTVFLPARSRPSPVLGTRTEPAVTERFHLCPDLAGLRLRRRYHRHLCWRIVGWRVARDMRLISCSTRLSRRCTSEGRLGNGLFKAKVIHHCTSWRRIEDVEIATLHWVVWLNHCKLLKPIGNILPAEAESAYYAILDAMPLAA